MVGLKNLPLGNDETTNHHGRKPFPHSHSSEEAYCPCEDPSLTQPEPTTTRLVCDPSGHLARYCFNINTRHNARDPCSWQRNCWAIRGVTSCSELPRPDTHPAVPERVNNDKAYRDSDTRNTLPSFRKQTGRQEMLEVFTTHWHPPVGPERRCRRSVPGIVRGAVTLVPQSERQGL